MITTWSQIKAMDKLAVDRLEMKRREGMLNQLRNLNIERMDLDEAVTLSAFGRTLEAEYSQVGSPVPEWLSSNTKELRREIASRLRDSLEKRLIEAKARRESLTPVEEKRNSLDREIEELTAKLGK